jgi:hypothetical protein
MSKQECFTTPTGCAAKPGVQSGTSLELKPEWVQQTLKVERLTSAQVRGAEDQVAGEVQTEERMSIVLPAGSSVEAAREALAEFINGLG